MTSFDGKATPYQLGPVIASGGFGMVNRATAADGTEVAAKFVPKSPGAERELLFAEFVNVPHVVPTVD